MPRNMSFMLTTKQIENKTKTVTRRRGWLFLKGGETVNACEKCQGLKKGEKINKLSQIRIKNTRREPLDIIDQLECEKEGFPDMTPDEFIDMYVTHMGGAGDQYVTRIEFEYL